MDSVRKRGSQEAPEQAGGIEGGVRWGGEGARLRRSGRGTSLM